ncbi:hypothetical protein KCU97_g23422, partial [Aureobasidium melanogenum]
MKYLDDYCFLQILADEWNFKFAEKPSNLGIWPTERVFEAAFPFETIRILSAKIELDDRVGDNDISKDKWSVKRGGTTDTDNKGKSDSPEAQSETACYTGCTRFTHARHMS